MAREAVLIYPHQLFRKHPALRKDRMVIFAEDPLFFRQYPFHKKKLVFHRASMTAFAHSLEQKGFSVEFVSSASLEKTKNIFDTCGSKKIDVLHVGEPEDDWLKRRLIREAKAKGTKLFFHSTPGFISPLEWSSEALGEKDQYFFTSFYIAQRKRLNILLEEGKPLGGKWTYDQENRKKLPQSVSVPEPSRPRSSVHLREALEYVENSFPGNPGTTEDFIFPVTHLSAERWLDDFLVSRLGHFGDFEDALTTRSEFVFHSVLSPLLNVGLLTPKDVVDRAIDFSQDRPVALNSLEGFIRQIIGWREFIRVIYHLKSVRQRKANNWKHSRKIPSSFWSASTGIEPVDQVIRKVEKHAYAHHIERLMVLGNFMLLCEFDPDEIYRWFMALFIDAYDWVMVPNVYGMSQYADGGLMTTKPYISSSNYIKKMSDYPPGPWCETWDGLYWRFLAKHEASLKSNPRMKLILSQLQKMNSETLKRHKAISRRFLSKLDEEM